MSFIKSLDSVSKLFKVQTDKPVIDNFAFKCHYKLTTGTLLLFCALLSLNDLIGNPIQCLSDKKDDGEKKFIDTYCWVFGTFTYDNVDLFDNSSVPKKEMKRQHLYYQWVPFVIFFQAITFYLPHLIWKMMEGGKIKQITEDLRHRNLQENADERRKKQNKLVEYFIWSFHTHDIYAFKYVFCEILNLISIFGNIYITNKFLSGDFLTYGYNVGREYYEQTAFSIRDMIFPLRAKCHLPIYGPSGSIQLHDAICLLAENILNEKIYLLIWIWFGIVAILSICTLLYRITVIMQIITKRYIYVYIFKDLLVYKLTKNEMTKYAVFRKCHVGDFFLLHLIEKNIRSNQFQEIMEKINSTLNKNCEDNVKIMINSRVLF